MMNLPITALCFLAAGAPTPAEFVSQHLTETGVQGGLVVHVGCGDGTVTASLKLGDNFRVQGLDASAENIAAARARIQAAGLYGDISMLTWFGNCLPYNDNLVNVLVVQEPGSVSRQEIQRVLAPRGVAFVRNGDQWNEVGKTPPPDSDDWTHALYDARGNAVSKDRIVGPSKHLQWFGGPKFGRQHEHMSSFSALVSDAGRIFYIVDEGSPVSIMLPSDWKLVCKDAHNGCLLWERTIDQWHSRYWPMKNGPVSLPRRLVAVDGRVYVTLGIHAPIGRLDAATGATLRRYDATAGTYEFVVAEGVIFAVVGQEGRYFTHRREREDTVEERNLLFKRSLPKEPRDVVAVSAETGEVLWSTESPVTQSSLAVDKHHVVFHDQESVVCLDRNSGRRCWSTPVQQKDQYQFGQGATLVLADDVILFSGMMGTTTALSADSGAVLWTAPQPNTGHHSPYDLFVVDDQVWYGQTASGRQPGTFTGLNLHTGDVEKTFEMDSEPYWFHHRCHRARATENYLITSRTGVEFIDFRKAEYDVNHWVRGACTYGIMPANGLLYAPPHPCACYLSAKLSHFNALTPASQLTYSEQQRSPKQRLTQGSTIDRSDPQRAAVGTSPVDDWPCYRHDMARSGTTQHCLPATLEGRWEAAIGGKPSACTAADGRLFVAAVDRHTLVALDTDSGQVCWRFTAGGRIDSPPAVIGGRVVFGSADGGIYCLTADRGAFVWQYDAAPQRRQMMALGQLESPWPVHGSVYVQDNIVYAIAGRSRFLDGGLHLVLLDADRGRLLSEKILNAQDNATGHDLHTQVNGLGMPVALSDILSGNGKRLFLRSQVIDLAGNPLNSKALEDGDEDIRHLFTPTGFLDDSWFHRTYWLYGAQFHSGWNQWYRSGRRVPAGRILVQRGSSIFGFGRIQSDFRWMSPLGYHLFHIDCEPRLQKPSVKDKAGYNQPAPNEFEYHWSRSTPLFVRAMVLAGDTLFIAGPPRIFDEKKQWSNIYDPKTEAMFEKQAKLLDGAEGCWLWAVSADTGKKLAEYQLDSIPVWDGMAVAHEQLYVPLQNGTIVCLGKTRAD